MTILDALTTVVDDIASAQWELTDGRVVPESEDVGLGNVGVKLEAAMLYADLADSTELASYSQPMAAEIYKAFLYCATKLILNHGGYVRSFDGDRVMGVFIGKTKNTPAVKTAMNLKYVFDNVIVPRFKKEYEVIRNGTLVLNYCAGIDTGPVTVARAGVRDNNDLVWVGQAPNVAAKLSTLRAALYKTYITKAVYDGMHESVKTTEGKNMWEVCTWSDLPEGKRDLYRSSWHWKP